MTQKLKVMSLFAGIGGFDLGLERTGGFETVAFCEIDKFCQQVLKKHWPNVPIYEDVRTLEHDGPIDVICGGYPCQPFSVAGKRKGEEDDRHLWPSMFSLVEKHRPDWVIGENVFGHINMGLDQTLTDLESEGYTTTSFVIPACAVDAPHRRDRVWILAHTESINGRSREKQKQQKRNTPRKSISYRGKSLSNSTGERQQRSREFIKPMCDKEEKKRETDFFITERQPCFWPIEPQLGQVANGILDRSHQLKSLGNSVLPQIPEFIGNAILEVEGMK